MNSLIESMKKWSIERPDEELVTQFTTALNIPSVHAKILISRGITTINEVKAFLEIDDDALHDPYLFHQMDRAVELIKNAIAMNKKIAIYGDYDADGVTSIAVMMTALNRLGADVFYVIPNRFEHGYGPHKDLFQEIYEAGASMIITVDNGVAGNDEVAFAKTLGMDVIITDHHEAGEVLPDADAILHPRHPDGQYPFKDLAGVGVAFKLACALLESVPTDLLELVAIGTVADLVPLHGENRYFVKKGIELLRKTKRPGIQAVLNIASSAQSQLTEETLGFLIGPRLNAPGRLEDAGPAVELLMTEDSFMATGLAEELDAFNKERQAIVSTITKEAEAMIADMYGNEVPPVFVIAKEGWNPGVVGIVASRLTDKYYRPAIVLAIDHETGMAKGSARSIEGFNIYEELTKNASILGHFGGHPVAAGLSLEIQQIEPLRERLIMQAEQSMTEEQFIPQIAIDVPLSLDEIDISVLESLEHLRPFGMGFEKPLYLIENVTASSIRKIGADRNHLKLEITDGNDTLDAIGFRLGEIADNMSPGVQFSIVGDLQINEWNGNKKPQLLVEDIHSNEWQLFDLRGIREVSRWLYTVPSTRTTFLAFHERTVNHLQAYMNGHEIQVFGDHQLEQKASLVLLDMPNNSTDLQEIVKECIPSRIYAHFYVPESTYFDAIPGREQFGWYYTFLKSRGNFDLAANGEKLANHKGWKKDDITFMSEVFSELGFVKMEDGLISFLDTNEKRDLTEASTYQRRVQKMELEKKLLYAPYSELKRWFDHVRAVDREEQ